MLTGHPLYQLSYASLCVSPLDCHIPGWTCHHYVPSCLRPRGSFQEGIVILCEVNRNAHIIRVLPGLWSFREESNHRLLSTNQPFCR